jgi:hypothetical protein
MSNRPSPGLTILDSMILIAGVSFGLWLFQDELKFSQLFTAPDDDQWLVVAVSIFTGVSLAGTPLIIIDRIRSGRRWRSGALHWVAIGLAAWSLVPALSLERLKLVSGSAAAKACIVYSLPLMGLFLLLATIIGGRPVSGWLNCRGWWPEWLGMWILIGWAAIGCYVLFLVYHDLG